MIHLDLRMKIFLPVAIVLAVLVLMSTLWVVRQTHTLSDEFQNELTTLALTSRFSVHSSAAEFAKSKGLEFHRIVNGHTTDGSVQSALISEAEGIFESDINREVFTKEVVYDGETRLYAFSPARIQSSCRMCHNANGIDPFPNKKDGELAAIFGVSGSTENIQASSNYLWYTLFGACFLSCILIAVAIFVVFDKVAKKPLGEILTSSKSFAQGDLTKKVRIKSDGEIGELGEAFNSMVANIDATLCEVSLAMNAVASATMKMSSSTEQMASGTEEHRTQASEVATATEEMAHTVSENARNVAILADTVRESKNVADQGGEAVKNTITSVRNIGSSVQNFTASILSLNSSSEQIGEIVGVINDIADQTNLLALNAAIEAARAGEHGRGFSVVADEVRKLAERTMQATKEIASKIKKIQEESVSAVSYLEQGISAVEDGIEHAEQAGIMLNGIVEISGAVVEVVTQMASTTEEQSSTGEQIAKSLEAINVVTQQTSSGVQEMARVTEDLSQMSQRVLDLLGKFKIESSEIQQDSLYAGSISAHIPSNELSERGRLLNVHQKTRRN